MNKEKEKKEGGIKKQRKKERNWTERITKKMKKRKTQLPDNEMKTNKK